MQLIYLLCIGLDSPRIRSGFGALLGIICFYIISIFYHNKNNFIFIQRIFYFVVCMYFLFNIVNYIELINMQCLVNDEEKNLGLQIKNDLYQYELKENTEVKYVINIYDYNRDQYFFRFNRKCVITQSAYTCAWSSVQVLNFYTDKNLILIDEIGSNEINFLEDYKIVDDILYIRVHKF